MPWLGHNEVWDFHVRLVVDGLLKNRVYLKEVWHKWKGKHCNQEVFLFNVKDEVYSSEEKGF